MVFSHPAASPAERSRNSPEQALFGPISREQAASDSGCRGVIMMAFRPETG